MEGNGTISECLKAMHEVYKKDPLKAVRSQNFIYHLHDYCISTLSSLIDPSTIQVLRLEDMNRPRGGFNSPKTPIDPKKFQIMPEATVYGSHKNKNADVVMSQHANGPLIIIGIRSQMSSVGNNIANYYEGIIGECISLHDRFPMAVIGYIYLLPTFGITKDKKTNEIKRERVDLERAEKLFSKITDRCDWRGPHDKYEHFAFLKVDFESRSPELLPVTNERLALSGFFDKLIDTYNERNIFNQIKRRSIL